jgi:hypothetical protein
MGFYARYVLPRMLDFTMRQKVLRPFRERIAGAAEGRVLEIGLGGLNLPLYGGNVRSVIGLEPSPELLRLARRYAAAVPIELVKGSAEATFFRSHARAGNRQFCWVFWTWPKRKTQGAGAHLRYIAPNISVWPNPKNPAKLPITRARAH